MSTVQAPNAVIMVRPWKFYPNPETAEDNAFQKKGCAPTDNYASMAKQEVDNMVATLRSHGITVHLFDDYGEEEDEKDSGGDD